MKPSNRTLLTIFGLAVMLGTLATYASSRFSQPVAVRSAEVSFVTDFRDARKLAGFVDNIFVGKVVTQTGTQVGSSLLPETTFQVEILRSVKGSLSGTVLVTQQGGFNPEERAIILVEEDALLEPGKTYLLATKADGKLHVTVPKYGKLAITSASEEAALVRQYEQATREQILFRLGQN
jgi:hypothetical protein